MAKPAISQAANRSNLLITLKTLQGLDVFPFFGTMLGYARQGDIIEDDDDIDLYIERKSLPKVTRRMQAVGFKVSMKKPDFLQFARVIDGQTALVDFYLYDFTEDKSHIIEKWAFLGSPKDERTHLHIPVGLIFPLQPRPLADGVTLYMPHDVIGCCRYLYGPKWQTPMSKSQSDYITLVHHNQPLVMYRGDALYTIYQDHLAHEALMKRRARREKKAKQKALEAEKAAAGLASA